MLAMPIPKQTNPQANVPSGQNKTMTTPTSRDSHIVVLSGFKNPKRSGGSTPERQRHPVVVQSPDHPARPEDYLLSSPFTTQPASAACQRIERRPTSTTPRKKIA